MTQMTKDPAIVDSELHLAENRSIPRYGRYPAGSIRRRVVVLASIIIGIGFVLLATLTSTLDLARQGLLPDNRKIVVGSDNEYIVIAIRHSLGGQIHGAAVQPQQTAAADQPQYRTWACRLKPVASVEVKVLLQTRIFEKTWAVRKVTVAGAVVLIWAKLPCLLFGLFFSLAVPMIASGWHCWTILKRRRAFQCIFCGYSRTGWGTSTCPECGIEAA